MMMRKVLSICCSSGGEKKTMTQEEAGDGQQQKPQKLFDPITYRRQCACGKVPAAASFGGAGTRTLRAYGGK